MTSPSHRIAVEAATARALLLSVAETVADDDQAQQDVIEGETSLIEAITVAVRRIADVDAHAAALDTMIKDMKDRKHRFENAAETLRNSIRSAMETTSQAKFELPMATISLRKVPPKVDIVDPMAIPDIYLKQPPPVVDKVAIKLALTGGVDVPGARMSNGSQTLAIKFG